MNRVTVSPNELGHLKLTYRYSVGEIRCKFHMLCEVGAPWQREMAVLRDGTMLLSERVDTITDADGDTYDVVVRS